MLGHRTLCKRQDFYDFPADAGVSLGQFFQNGDPGRMRECFGEFREFLFVLPESFFFMGGHIEGLEIISQKYDEYLKLQIFEGKIYRTFTIN
jgi:hypothetical protein